jgi:autoinducer 2 (AI-2) kinase
MNYAKWYHAAPSFLNLSLDAATCNPISMFRALEENAAIVSDINLKKVEQFTSLKVKEIVFAGGASKGALWSQILADVTGCQVKIPKVTEATALGAAMAAGVGVGIYESLQSAAETLVVWDKTFNPNLKHTKIYDSMKVKFQKAYAMQRKLVDDNITTSMWKAPGL